MDAKEELQIPIEKLKNSCRICGKQLITDRKYNKFDFREELGELYGIELNFDQEEVHPPFICGNDANVFYRVRNARKSKELYQTDLIPVFFDNHSADCKICFTRTAAEIVGLEQRKPGRPSKRKIGSAEKITKQWHLNDNTKKKNESPEQSSTCSHRSIDINCLSCITSQFCQLIIRSEAAAKETIFERILCKLSSQDISTLSFVIGRKESSAIRRDAASFALLYKNLADISTFNTFNWVKERNSVLINFLLGIGNVDTKIENINTVDQEKIVALASTVENSYKLNTSYLVSPLAFLQNVTIYALTGSKIALDMIGHTKPAGGYKTILAWLREQGSKPASVPDTNILYVFDNEQIIGYKTAIKPNNKANVSIITNKGYVELDHVDSHSNLQRDEGLKPLQILKLKEIESSSESKIHDHAQQNLQAEFKEIVNSVISEQSEIYSRYESIHYEQLCFYVETALEIVLGEQKKHNDQLVDSIDVEVDAEENQQILKCTECGAINSKRRKICIDCGKREGIEKWKKDQKQKIKDPTPMKRQPTFCKLEFKVQDDGGVHIQQTELKDVGERYEHVTSNHRGKKEIILTDPVFCNPNSFVTVAHVLRQIGMESGISKYQNDGTCGRSSREWMYICCDGVPFMICKKLKEEAVVCTIDDCKKTFYNKKEYESHCKEDHSECEEQTYIHEFDWFFLKIGGGHYEMNLVKSLFELNWVPVLESMCEVMGFLSDAAKLYAKTCKDHHKSWNLLLIFHFACLRELVLPYVRHSIVQNSEVNAKGHFVFAHEIYKNSRNYRYLMDQVCRLSQGIINYRIGIRRNNAELVHSAKFMTKEIFHGRVHPKYQEIELYDHMQYLLMPGPVKELYDNFTSITTSGNTSSGQDFDFVLEEKNRQLKQWINKGVPIDEIWQTICRNNATLEQIRGNTMAQIGIRSGERKLKELDIEEAVFAFRLLLRKNKYLAHGSEEHTSLDGKSLDYDLINFTQKATIRRIYKLKNSILQEIVDDLPTMSQPVPVTPAEREKLESVNAMTKIQIEKEIQRLTNLISDQDLQSFYVQYFRQQVKGKKKSDYISYLAELKNMIDMAMSAQMHPLELDINQD